jgi:GT2 family glycosyltransferase
MKAATPLPRVLVSVLTYNSGRRAVETVASLRALAYPRFHLQVVDNGSTDGSARLLRQSFPDLDVVDSGTNRGYAGGNNVALERGVAEGFDHVLTCNDDIATAPDALGHLVETAEACEDAGVVGGVEVDAESGRPRTTGGLQPPDWRCRIRWTLDSPAPGHPASRALFVQGALVLFTRRALERGVRFDEKLFMYWDEIELGYELASRGLAAYVDHRVLVRHRNDPAALNPRTGYLQQRNRAYIARKRFPSGRRAAYLVYSTFLELPGKVIVRTLQGHPRFALACLLGHWDGIRARMGPGRLESLPAVR